MEENELAGQTWIFVGPHDDDICLGAGLMLQAAVLAGVDVRILVVTDGRMGYCSDRQRNTIVETRKQETYDSFAMLGVDVDLVEFLNFPDSGLSSFQGRRMAATGENSMAIEGYVGLQNSFTYFLRKFRPTRIFVPTPTDLHPDHQMTHRELMISLFHAAGDIWPELGPPQFEEPKVYETAVYCDFAEAPNIEVQASADFFQKKLDGIRAFQSQTQIGRLVKRTIDEGPYEFFREVDFRFYSTRKYTRLFEDRRND